MLQTCTGCDSAYGLVSGEVKQLTELAANISSVADLVTPDNSSAIITGTFYERLQQTRTSLDDLISVVSSSLVLGPTTAFCSALVSYMVQPRFTMLQPWFDHHG